MAKIGLCFLVLLCVLCVFAVQLYFSAFSAVRSFCKGAIMSTILLIGLGGFLGSVLRYGVSGAVQSLAGGVLFPVGTLAVNLTGCFVIGFLSQLADAREVFTPESRAF